MQGIHRCCAVLLRVRSCFCQCTLHPTRCALPHLALVLTAGNCCFVWQPLTCVAHNCIPLFFWTPVPLQQCLTRYAVLLLCALSSDRDGVRVVAASPPLLMPLASYA
jgi:hypothetical protein